MGQETMEQEREPLSAVINPQRLVSARKEAGLSQTELARLAKLSPQAIQQLEEGSTRRTRRLGKIAGALKRKPEWFTELDEGHPGLKKVIVEKYAELKGSIAAGVWGPHGGIVSGGRRIMASVPESFKDLELVGYEVRGDWLNREVVDGDVIIGVDHEKHPVQLRNGELAIVERQQDGRVETLMGRVVGEEPRLQFLPVTDDERFQAPFAIPSRESDPAVRIVARPIRLVRDLR